MAVAVSSALAASLVIDHFGWIRMDVHPITPLRALGGVQLISEATLIAKFCGPLS